MNVHLRVMKGRGATEALVMYLDMGRSSKDNKMLTVIAERLLGGRRFFVCFFFNKNYTFFSF